MRHKVMPDADANDPYDLRRFVEAQENVYEEARAELREGRKRGHWMWFIFPQVKGLGHSHTAQQFAISSSEEAEAYLNHPTLGPRLRECTQLVNLAEGRSASEIFGGIDGMKFRSSMTLFAHATPDNEVFKEALRKYFGDEYDRLTLERL
jgi:uncharacterized protein (DUF1810 family)